MNILEKDAMIKFKEKLRELIPEVIEDLQDDCLFITLADNMTYVFVQVLNEERLNRSPETPLIGYEIW